MRPALANADHPDVPFVQARGFTPGRPDGPVLWWVFHELAADELPGVPQAAAEYLRAVEDREISLHYCFDADFEVQCVKLRDCAWAAGNRPGNRRGVHAALAGSGRQSRAQWLDEEGRRLLARVARIAARDMRRYRIPQRWCTMGDLAALRPGLTTHYDLSLVFGGAVRADPGPDFPRDHVLALIRAELAGDDDPMPVGQGPFVVV
jgi:hypothetical protein